MGVTAEQVKHRGKIQLSFINKKLFVREARKCIVVCANCHRKIGRVV